MGTGGISRHSPQIPLHASLAPASQRGAPLHFAVRKRQTFNSYSWHLLFLIGGGSALGWAPSATVRIALVCSVSNHRPGRPPEWLAEAGHGVGEEAPQCTALAMGLRVAYLLKPPPSRPVHFAILKPQTLQRVGCRCRCRGCGLESWAFGLRDSRWVGFQYMRFMTRTPKNPNFLKL